jgi:hypothetical protein
MNKENTNYTPRCNASLQKANIIPQTFALGCLK